MIPFLAKKRMTKQRMMNLRTRKKQKQKGRKKKLSRRDKNKQRKRDWKMNIGQRSWKN